MRDPIECLKEDAPTKSSFKELIETKITAFYEKELRTQALENSCMKFFNVSLIGLRGRPHPALSNITTSHQAKKAKQHLKMLGGDYFTYEKKSKQSGGSPFCRSCRKDENEDIPHIIAGCTAYSEIRDRIRKEYEEIHMTGSSTNPKS